MIAIVIAFVTLLALHEFFELGSRNGFRGYRIWTIFCSLGFIFAQWKASAIPVVSENPVFLTGTPHALELLGLIFIVGCTCFLLLSQEPDSQRLLSLTLTISAFVLISVPLSYLIRFLGLASIGRKILLLLLAMVWVGDSAAYFAGRAFGKHLMSPRLSPKKTWEGAVANLVCTILFLVGFELYSEWTQFQFRELWLPTILAASVSVAGQIGDFVESAYKRAAGAKDSGNLLPGHGGVLDRIDALIFAAPTLWFVVSLFLESGKF